MFLALFALSNFSIATALGMNQVMMATLEKLFNLTSKQIGDTRELFYFFDRN